MTCLRHVLLILVALSPVGAAAETVVAAVAIRAGTVLTAADLKLSPVRITGALRSIDAAVGRQAERNLFPGHAVFARDLQAPHLVERNQTVTITFHGAGLSIVTEGRALEDGAAGDRIRVRNANSRKTVLGTVLVDGTISVSGADQ